MTAKANRKVFSICRLRTLHLGRVLAREVAILAAWRKRR
jgi:hypothetical protein